MRNICIMLLLCIPLLAKSQILKERRVYYLDCSYSMKANGLWGKVRENLKNAIDNISDQTTEIIVIPFADCCSTNPVLCPMIEYATETGKSKLKNRIDKLPMNKNTMTYHYIPLKDFYEKRVNDGRVTYMFLMTDGKDEDPRHLARNNLIPQWSDKYGKRNVFGFYVMLNNSAKDPEIENIIEKEKHLWKVETADVNINLVRLQAKAIFNAKNDKYFDLPIYGSMKNMKLHASFDVSCPYLVRSLEQSESKLRVWVDIKQKGKLPISKVYSLNVNMTGGGQYDFLVTDNISITCENKPERSLKISVR